MAQPKGPTPTEEERPSIAGTIELLVDDVHAALKDVRQQAEAEVLARADRHASDANDP
jgi:ribosome recycling factor